MCGRKPNDAEIEVLALKYNKIREEIQLEKELGHRRATQGIAAVGLVAGYALLSEQPTLFALVPLLIVFIFVLTVASVNEVLLLSWQAYEIEEVIDVEGFDYEHELGVLNRDNKRSRLSKWYSVPPLFILFIMIIGYVVFAGLSIEAVRGEQALGYDFDYLLTIGYALTTLLIVITLVSLFAVTSDMLAKVQERDVGRLGLLYELLSDK